MKRKRKGKEERKKRKSCCFHLVTPHSALTEAQVGAREWR